MPIEIIEKYVGTGYICGNTSAMINCMQKRVFQIEKKGIGSGFVIECDGKQYFITAFHNIPEVFNRNEIELDVYTNNIDKFKKIKFKIVGYGNIEDPNNTGYLIQGEDVLVLESEYKFNIDNKLVVYKGGYVEFDSDVRIFGFPTGRSTIFYNPIDVAESNKQITVNQPYSCIARGSVSGFDLCRKNVMNYYIIQGSLDRGFSGGPVATYTTDKCGIGLLNIIGIVSYSFDKEEKMIICVPIEKAINIIETAKSR